MSTKKKIEFSLDEALAKNGPISFGDLLLSHRMCEEMTQIEMAKFLGISKQSLCDLEKGRALPSLTRAANIAKKLGMLAESFVEVAIQDQLRKQKLSFEVKVTKKSPKAKVMRHIAFR